MPLPREFLERVRDANHIDDVMRQYVTLHRSGHGYKCLCPFHSERTPSCMVYTDTENFYCFGCGAGGDVITFIEKIENLDYIEAVRFLAQRSAIPMPEDGFDDRAAKAKKRILEMNRETAKFFYSNLKTNDGRAGLEYLINKRRLAASTIKKFGIGVASNHWTALLNHMTALGYTEQELTAASLASQKNGRYFDFFVNRVIFPIFDIRGNVIAFSGRTLESDPKGMKYLNSRGTPVYEKSRTLFAMNFAKNKAAKTKRLILCEGNVDVVTLHQAGFDEAVATCGTALTPEHARLMSAYCDEVFICYDADEAGQKATAAAIDILSAAGLKARVVSVAAQGVKDVDDYINKLGAERFKLLLDGSSDSVAYKLSKCRSGLDMDSDSGRVEYLRRAVVVLAGIESKIEREVYTLRLAAEQGVPKEVITAELTAYLSKKHRSEKNKEWQRIETGRQQRDSINPEAAAHPKEAKAEEGIIAYLMSHPDRAGRVFGSLGSDKFVTSFHRRVYEKLKKCYEAEQSVSLSSLSDEFSADEMGRISYILAKFRELTVDEKTLDDYVRLLNNNKPSGSGGDMTDDEFLNYVNNLRKTK